MNLIRSALISVSVFLLCWLAQAQDRTSQYIQDLRDKNPEVRAQAAGDLGTTADSRAVVPLVSIALVDQNSGVRSRAAEALGALARQAHIYEEGEGMAVGEKEEAARILNALRENREALEAALRDKKESVRLSAVEALGHFRSSDSIPSLIKALDDKAWDVAGAATASLVKIGEAAVGPLTDYLDSQKEPNENGLTALERLGHNELREKFSQAKADAKVKVAAEHERQQREKEQDVWAKSGFSAEEAQKWGKAGLSVGEYQFVITPAVAQRWKKAGFSPEEAAGWQQYQAVLTPEEAGAWRKAEFSPEEYEQWRDITPDSAVLWRKAGFSPEQTGAIFKYGIDFSTIDT